MPHNHHETFDGLGIAPAVLEYLDEIKFITPTPIQRTSIPIAVEGKDVIGIAQTGTGKTLAFSIPMIQRLAQNEKDHGLILVPTRELAIQVNETIEPLAALFKMKSVVLIGGDSMPKQITQLKKHPRIFVATPGRLIDHMRQRNMTLKDVRVLILDEADRMLDMGFMPQIQSILKEVPTTRQTMLFSATMPQSIMRLASSHMKLPIQTEIAPSGSTADNVTQELFIVRNEYKAVLLEKLLHQYTGSVLVFCRTIYGCQRTAGFIAKKHHRVAEIHSELTLAQRKESIEGFKSGKHRILIATDIAARGIDVTGIELVVNFDLPDDAENYVHRIGRTGRAGHDGHAISFAMPDQRNEVTTIEGLIKGNIPISKHPEVPNAEFPKPRVVFSSSRRRR